jgi:hypothetical protein
MIRQYMRADKRKGIEHGMANRVSFRQSGHEAHQPSARLVDAANNVQMPNMKCPEAILPNGTQVLRLLVMVRVLQMSVFVLS